MRIVVGGGGVWGIPSPAIQVIDPPPSQDQGVVIDPQVVLRLHTLETRMLSWSFWRWIKHFWRLWRRGYCDC
jgi:hypothetical protein